MHFCHFNLVNSFMYFMLNLFKLGLDIWYILLGLSKSRIPDYYAPTSKKLEGHIVFGLSVIPCICASLRHAFCCMPYLMSRVCEGCEISYMDSSWKNS